MPLFWVTGNSGSGKSTACETLRRLGFRAIDADDDGLSRWVARSSGAPVADPPYPVPVGWLDEYGWEIDRAKVETLSRDAEAHILFLCGSVENEASVRDLFERVVCLIVNDDTLRDRLATRTNNAFGRNPEELEAAIYWNARTERSYRRTGASIVDGTQTPEAVAAEILRACLNAESD